MLPGRYSLVTFSAATPQDPGLSLSANGFDQADSITPATIDTSMCPFWSIAPW